MAASQNSSFYPPADMNYRMRIIMYLLTPQETYIENLKDVPDLGYTSRPAMFFITLVEILILLVARDWKNLRLHNIIINLTLGHMTEAGGRFVARGIEFTAYLWIYKYYRIFDLPYNSLATYVMVLLAVDLCTYVWHRMSHEIAIIWAAHEMHHSCEDCNSTVAGRISLTMLLFKWVYYLPLAFVGVPPSLFIIHSQMNFFYGYCCHSTTVPKLHKIVPILGHLVEFIIVTPSHHRVHHGSNKYCIDKNFGSLLIVWDRLFGTFAEEREDEELVYGVIGQTEATHLIDLQLESWRTLWARFTAAKTPGDKLRTLLYGPGWSPGKPRLGNPEDIPDVRGRKRHTFDVPIWYNVYVIVHCCLLIAGITDMATRWREVSRGLGLLHYSYVVLTGYSLGGLFSAHRGAAWLELLRLLISLPLCHLLPVFTTPFLISCLTTINVISIFLWPVIRAQVFSLADRKIK